MSGRTFDNIKNQFSLVSSNLLGAVINGFFLIYLATILEKSDYGELGYLLAIPAIISNALLLGLPTIIVYSGAKKESVFQPAYTLGLIVSFISAIVAYIVTQNIALSFLAIGHILIPLMKAYFNSQKRYMIFSMLNILRIILFVGFGLFFYYIFGIDGILWGFALAQSPSLIGLYYYLKSKRVSLSLLKPKFWFMFNDYVSGLFSTLVFSIDKIIIGSLLGFTFLASYQLTLQPYSILAIIPTSLMVYLAPQEAEGIKNTKFKIYTVLLCILLTFVVFFTIPFAVESFLPKYQEIIFPIQIIVFSIIPSSIASILTVEFYAKNKSRYALIGTALQSIVFLILITIFSIVNLGLIEIIIAFIISTIIHMFSLLAFKKLIF